MSPLDILYLLIENEITEDNFNIIMKILYAESINDDIINKDVIIFLAKLYSKINHCLNFEVQVLKYINDLLSMYKITLHTFTSLFPDKDKANMLKEELKILMNWINTTILLK